MLYICWIEPFDKKTKHHCVKCTTKESIIDYMRERFPDKYTDEQLVESFMADHYAFYLEDLGLNE